MELEGGHGFGHWWEKYSKKNPDFFALQPDGTRSPNPTTRHTKMCESSPKLWDQWLAEVDEQLRENPTKRLFNVSENDGYGYGHCVCKECQAKDRPEADLKAYWDLLERTRMEFTQLVVSTRAAMQKFETSSGKDDAAKAQVLANWARVDVMEKEYPAFAINWRSVFSVGNPGGRNKRTEGLHPDAPLSPRTLRDMQAPDLE